MLITITQSYIPEYRVPLFDAIAALAEADGNRLEVVTAHAHGSQAARGDQASGYWHHTAISKHLTVHGRQLTFRSPRMFRDSDLLVTELDPGNALAWQLAFSNRRRWITWGHGASYTTRPVVGSNAARAFIASRSDRVLTYSDRGREFLLRYRCIEPHRVISVGNSTDTDRLVSGRLALNEEPAQHALFVGALDTSKRIEFVLAAADAAKTLDDSFALTLVGQGPLSEAVESFAESRDWVVWHSSARGEALAKLARNASAIWMPGRVGLVAVDALALGLPVHTTRFRFHAPELDYLVAGRSVAFLPDDAHAFAQESLNAMRTMPRFTDPEIPSIPVVANRFYGAIRDALAE